MTRALFERHLKALNDDVLLLGSMVEKAVVRSVDALKARDMDASRQIIKDDIKINEKRYDIEETCIHLLATQQPMAQDLRNIIAILHIAVELERMGDYAEGISRLNVRIGDEPLIKPLIDIPRMVDKAVNMLRRSLDAFVRSDTDEARQVCLDDDEVDALHEQVYRELIVFMLQDPKNITQATYLTWISHDLERIADRSTNICERVIFSVTGKMEEIGVSKY